MIETPEDLDNIRNNTSGHYELANDIDLSGINWEPINYFKGTLDGNGFKITNLTINRPSLDYVGLFNLVNEDGEVRDIVFENVDINARYYTGTLTGMAEGSKISGISVEGGSVNGYDYVGGIIGQLRGDLKNSHTTVDVTGRREVGGLIGRAKYYDTRTHNNFVENVYSTGNINGTKDVGGLIGFLWGDIVVNAYTTGSVEGRINVGGVIGRSESNGPEIHNVLTTSSVIGVDYVGGLVGNNLAGRNSNLFALNRQIVGKSDVGLAFGGYRSTYSGYWNVHVSDKLKSTTNTTNNYFNKFISDEQIVHQQTYEELGAPRGYSFDFGPGAWSIDEGRSVPYLSEPFLTFEPEIPIPEVPVDFKETNVTPDSITLQWGKDKDAESYVLKRDGTIIYEGNSTTFKDESLEANTTYEYELIAINESGASDPSTLTVSTTNNSPTIDKNIKNQTAVVNHDEHKYITIEDLNIYFRDEDGDSLSFDATSADKSIATTEVNGHRLTVEVLKDAETEITVTARDGNGGLTSQTFTVKGEYILSEVPELVVGETTNSSISLNWNELIGADEYVLERRPKQAGVFRTLSAFSPFTAGDGFEEVYRSSGTSFTDDNLRKGSRYEYRLKAVNKNSETESAIQEAYTYQIVTFHWLPVYDDNHEEAEAYEVSKNGEIVDTVTGTSYTDTKAVPGETNLYRATPIFADGTKGDDIIIDDIVVPEGEDDVVVDPPADQDQGNPPPEEGDGDGENPTDPDSGDENDPTDPGNGEGSGGDGENTGGDGDTGGEDGSDPTDPGSGEDGTGEDGNDSTDPGSGEDGSDPTPPVTDEDDNTPIVPPADEDQLEKPDNGNIGTPSNPPNPTDKEDPGDLDKPDAPGVDVGPDYMRLAWGAIDGAAYYEIKRNGTIIHTEDHVSGHDLYSYTDQPIDPTVSYHYEIIPYAANGDNITDEDGNNPIPPFDVLAKPTFTEMQDADGNLLLDLSDLSNGSTVASPEAESLVLTADYHDVKEGQVAEYYTDADGWTTYNDTISLTENGDVFLRVRSTEPNDDSVSAYSFLTFANIIGDGNGDEEPSKDYTAIPFAITDGFRGSKVLEMEELEDGVTVELRQQDETKYDAYARNGQANFGKVAAGTYDVYFDGAKHQDQAVIGDASGEDGSGEGDTGEPGEDLDYSTTPYEVVEGFRGSIGIRMTGLQDGETLEVTQNGEVVASATSKNTEAYFGRLQDGTYTLVINGQEHETPMVVGDAAGEDEGGTTPDGDFTALPYEVERGFRNAVLLNMEGLPKGQKVELRLDGSVIKTATSTNDKVNFGIVADGTYDLYINDKRHETPFSLQDNSDSGNDASGEDYQDTPFTVSNGFRNTINMEMEGLASGLRVELHQNGEVVASDTSSSGTANFGFVADGEYELYIQGTKHNQPFVVSAGGNGGSQPGGSDSSADYTTTPFEIVHGYRGSIGFSMEGLQDGVSFLLKADDKAVATATSLRGEVQFGEVAVGTYDVYVEGEKHQDTFTVGDPGAPEPDEPSLVTTPFTIKDGFRGSKTLQMEGLPKGSEVELKQADELVQTATARKGKVKLRSLKNGIYDLFIDGEQHAFSVVIGKPASEEVAVTKEADGYTLQLDKAKAGNVVAAFDNEGRVSVFTINDNGTAHIENLPPGDYDLFYRGYISLVEEADSENTLSITIE
nr:ZmpA/ZmpB/ZmpC family metallo-endopeptidase-related protein [Bacillus piscicola]